MCLLKFHCWSFCNYFLKILLTRSLRIDHKKNVSLRACLNFTIFNFYRYFWMDFALLD